MNEEIKISRGNPSNMAQQMSEPKDKNTKAPWAVLVIVIVVVVVLGVLFRDKLMGGKGGAGGMSGKQSSVSGQKYQAVFLANGQVYFGKVSNTSGEWINMKEIYYLQVVQPPLQGSGQQPQGTNQSPQISLVKLGQELHGPEDEMHINRDQILFWEDLKADGQVTKAIEDYKKNQNNPAK